MPNLPSLANFKTSDLNFIETEVTLLRFSVCSPNNRVFIYLSYFPYKVKTCSPRVLNSMIFEKQVVVSDISSDIRGGALAGDKEKGLAPLDNN